MHCIVASIILVMLFAPSFGCASSASGDAAGIIPLDPAVRIGRLDNGFTYYLRKNGNPTGRAEVWLTVNAGYFHEDPGQLGLAHLMEHVVHAGTMRFSGDPVITYLQKAGLRDGVDMNATTTSGQTMYFISLPVADASLYDNVLRIMRHRAQGLILDPELVDRERSAVSNEFSRKGNEDPLLGIWRRVLEHPRYPPAPLAAETRNVLTASHQSVVQFYRDWYRPDLEALIIVGDINVDDTEKRINALFSGLLMPQQPRPAQGHAAQYAVPLAGKNKVVVFTHEDLRTVELKAYMMVKKKCAARTTETDFRQALVGRVLNEALGLRMEKLRNSYGAPYENASAMFASFSCQAELGSLTTQLSFHRPEDIGPGFRAVMEELERIRRDGFPASEFKRAKDSVRKKLVAEPSAPSSASLAGAYLEHYSQGDAAPAPEFAKELNARLLQKIGKNDIDDLARQLIHTERDFDIALAAPASHKGALPAESQFATWTAGLRHRALTPRAEPGAVPSELMSAEEVAHLSSARVTHTGFIEELDVTRVKLSNGIELVIKPLPEAENSLMDIHGFRAGGLSAYADTVDRMSARAVGAIVSHSGVSRYDKFQLAALTGAHRISADAGIDEKAAHIRGNGPAAQLETILQLIYLRVTQPRKDTVAFDDWRRERLRAPARSPDTVLQQAVLERFEPRSNAAVFEELQIQDVNLDRAYMIYHDRISQSGDFTFVITGGFSLGNALPLLVKYLGALPAARSNVECQMTPPRTLKQASLDRRLHLGTNAAAQVQLFFTGVYADTFINRIKLDLLAELVRIRAHKRLRDQERGTYGVTTWLDRFDAATDSGLGTFAFVMSFETPDPDVERMIAAAKDEIATLGARGMDEALFNTVVAQARASGVRLLGPYNSWNDYLLRKVQNGGDMTEILKRQSIVSDILTRDTMNAAAREYLSADHVMSFVLLPRSARPVAFAH